MSFEKISSLLPKFKYRVKNGTTVEAAFVVEVANVVMRGVYDESIWSLMKVVFYRRGVLTVSVVASPVAYQAKLTEKSWCEQIKKHAGVSIEKIIWKTTGQARCS